MCVCVDEEWDALTLPFNEPSSARSMQSLNNEWTQANQVIPKNHIHITGRRQHKKKKKRVQSISNPLSFGECAQFFASSSNFFFDSVRITAFKSLWAGAEWCACAVWIVKCQLNRVINEFDGCQLKFFFNNLWADHKFRSVMRSNVTSFGGELQMPVWWWVTQKNQRWFYPIFETIYF